MLKLTLEKLYLDGLDALAKELGEYTAEDSIWALSGGISNSAGNLTLHLCGNLNHFIGTILGNSGYIRDRDSEFSDKGISRAELLKKIAETKTAVSASFEMLSDDDLEKDYPVEFKDRIWKSGSVLIYMYGHFSHHLGQVNYHRRLLS